MGVKTELHPVTYERSQKRFAVIAFSAPTLEMMQLIPGIHKAMPEPFDVTNHAGNFWVGGAVAYTPVLASFLKKNNPGTLNSEEMSRMRRYGVAAICGATALTNCITETRWGVKHLPIASWLGGTTPDYLDTLYSTVWAGFASLAFWKKKEQQAP